MQLDTETCKQIASAISGLKGSVSYGYPSLQARHAQIQAKLDALESFFRKLAELGENNENKLSSTQKIHVANQPGLVYNGTYTGSVSKLASGRTASAIGAASYAVGATSAAYKNDYVSSYGAVSALEANAQGKAYLRLVKNKKFDPKLDVEASASAHLAGVEGNAKIGNDWINAEIGAAAEVGAVYGEAQATFSKDEQVISAQVGAAAARGECSLAFELADAKVTVGVSGSVGSVEAGFRYANEPGHWEISTNGALFAGGGVRIQVEY